jgi:DNA-binding response OmpR family regulator
MTIVVAGDDEVIRQLTCRVLAEHGYSVLDAPHGFAALQLCEERVGAIELLVTDVDLPDMRGRELCKLAAASQPDLQVLYLVGNGESVDPEVALAKPFSATELVEKVTAMLDRR